MPQPGGRVAALDGIRGLAVLAVVAYHAGLPIRYGGMVGVTVFFALSGYLITGILAKEHDRTGRIDLRKFYIRRFLRLVPALVLMDFFGASGADMHLLGHTWSLAVEEQFYLVWPVLLIVTLRFTRSRRTARRVVLGAAVLALAWRVGVSLAGWGFDRIYYAPDTVFYALLAGCALALAPKAADRVPTWLGYLCTGLIAAMSLIPSIDFTGIDMTIQLYIGAAAGVLAVPMIAAAPRLRILAWRPLVFMGTISYGVYLWHQVFLQAHPFGHVATPVAEKVPLVIAACVVAWLSFRFVERPILAYKRRFETTHAEVDADEAVEFVPTRPAPSRP